MKPVFPHARLGSTDRRFTALLKRVFSKFPRNVEPISSVSELRLRRSGGMEGLVGLTTYCCVESANDIRRPKKPVVQRITFYSELLDGISGESAMGVIAREPVHASLNEHAFPENSKKRETEADELARDSGHGGYLDALAAETEVT